MIVGLGTDIVEISRLEAALARNGKLFRDRVFTEAEQREAGERLSYFAGRWAAKEAAAKALGCGIGAGCSFTDIEVLNDESGAPHLTCRAAAARCIRGNRLRYLVSISHEKAYAIATVIAESSD